MQQQTRLRAFLVAGFGVGVCLIVFSVGGLLQLESWQELGYPSRTAMLVLEIFGVCLGLVYGIMSYRIFRLPASVTAPHIRQAEITARLRRGRNLVVAFAVVLLTTWIYPKVKAGWSPAEPAYDKAFYDSCVRPSEQESGKLGEFLSKHQLPPRFAEQTSDRMKASNSQAREMCLLLATANSAPYRAQTITCLANTPGSQPPADRNSCYRGTLVNARDALLAQKLITDVAAIDDVIRNMGSPQPTIPSDSGPR